MSGVVFLPLAHSLNFPFRFGGFHLCEVLSTTGTSIGSLGPFHDTFPTKGVRTTVQGGFVFYPVQTNVTGFAL